MEFFSVISLFFTFALPPVIEKYGSMTSANYTYLAIGIAAGIYLIVYLFKAAGLSKMAVNAGKKKLAWCAFVPFASTYLMGELAGEMRFGNVRFKKIGLVAMIAEILYTASLAVFFVPQIMAYTNPSYYAWEVAEGGEMLRFSDLFPYAAYQAYNVGYILQYIFSFIYLLCAIFLYIYFFRKYAPGSYIWLTIVSAIITPVAAVLTFAFRNRKPFDYDAYMRARAEQIRRMQQQQYGNPNNPYGPYGGQNPNNPYGGPYGNQAPPQGGRNEPDDPFGEYADPKKGGDDPFSDFSDNRDGTDKKDE